LLKKNIINKIHATKICIMLGTLFLECIIYDNKIIIIIIIKEI
jgi:hypothetical protein